MNRVLVTLKILREYLHPLEDQLEHILHEYEDHRQFFTRNHVHHRDQRVYVEIKLTSDELGHLNRVTEVLEFLLDSLLDLLLYLLLHRQG